MKFNLVGGSQLGLRDTEPPAVKRARVLLSQLKDGDLLTSFMLGSRLQVSVGYVQRLNLYLPGHSAVVNHKRYFGNPATIIQLKKEFKQ